MLRLGVVGVPRTALLWEEMVEARRGVMGRKEVRCMRRHRGLGVVLSRGCNLVVSPGFEAVWRC